ncbi:hypothetical protein Tco_0445367 [Tanacetum coccineum]
MNFLSNISSKVKHSSSDIQYALPADVNSTVIVNINDSVHEIVPIIQQLVLNPEYLSTAISSSHISASVVKEWHHNFLLTLIPR